MKVTTIGFNNQVYILKEDVAHIIREFVAVEAEPYTVYRGEIMSQSILNLTAEKELQRHRRPNE